MNSGKCRLTPKSSYRSLLSSVVLLAIYDLIENPNPDDPLVTAVVSLHYYRQLHASFLPMPEPISCPYRCHWGRVGDRSRDLRGRIADRSLAGGPIPYRSEIFRQKGGRIHETSELDY